MKGSHFNEITHPPTNTMQFFSAKIIPIARSSITFECPIHNTLRCTKKRTPRRNFTLSQILPKKEVTNALYINNGFERYRGSRSSACLFSKKHRCSDARASFYTRAHDQALQYTQLAKSEALLSSPPQDRALQECVHTCTRSHATRANYLAALYRRS